MINEGERVRFSSTFFRRRNKLSTLSKELERVEKNLERVHPLLKEDEDYKIVKERIRTLKKGLKKAIKSKGFELKIKKYHEKIRELYNVYLRDLMEKDKNLKKGLIPSEYLLRILYAISNALPNSSLLIPVDDLPPYIPQKHYQQMIKQLKQQISILSNYHSYNIQLVKNGTHLKIKIDSHYQKEEFSFLPSEYLETLKNSLVSELEKMIKIIGLGNSE